MSLLKITHTQMLILKVTYNQMFMKDVRSTVVSIWYIQYSRYSLYNITYLLMFSDI